MWPKGWVEAEMPVVDLVRGRNVFCCVWNSLSCGQNGLWPKDAHVIKSIVGKQLFIHRPAGGRRLSLTEVHVSLTQALSGDRGDCVSLSGGRGCAGGLLQWGHLSDTGITHYLEREVRSSRRRWRRGGETDRVPAPWRIAAPLRTAAWESTAPETHLNIFIIRTYALCTLLKNTFLYCRKPAQCSNHLCIQYCACSPLCTCCVKKKHWKVMDDLFATYSFLWRRPLRLTALSAITFVCGCFLPITSHQ